MNPITEPIKAENAVVSKVLTLSRACAGGDPEKMKKKSLAQSYTLPLAIRRKVAGRLTPKVGTIDIRKLGDEHTVCLRPGITKAMGQLPLAYKIALRRKGNQLKQGSGFDSETCERCQYCVENLLMTDKGLFRLNMLCYSMGFTCGPDMVCRQWREGQGRTIVISDIRSKQKMDEQKCEDILMEYVQDCVADGEEKFKYYENEKMRHAKAIDKLKKEGRLPQ